MHWGRGGVQFSSGLHAPPYGQGGPEGGGEGGSSDLRALGPFLNSLFHSGHFEYSQIRQFPATIHQMGNMRGKRGQNLCPGPQRQKKIGAKLVVPHCSLMVWVGGSWGGGGPSDT